jgi:glycosyltransferase involved in cell wall biosynthesis
MSGQRVIALLGRRDQPTDAVEDYCRLLGEALGERGFTLEIRRVPWDQHGWSASLDALRLQAESWRGVWVLAQYTAMAWSARGFPRRFLQVLGLLRQAGARIAVVFHDAVPFGGTRLIDRLRRSSQARVMRAAVAFSDRAVFTVPPDKLPWLSGAAKAPENSSFIVVGANLPQPLLPQDHDLLHEPPCVAVYSITGGVSGERETENIVTAVRLASEKLGKLRLLVFGRHAEIREEALRQGLAGTQVEVSVEGVVDGDQLVDRFSAADVLLFLRGSISSRRGSAIAGISCGLPVIAMEGPETAPPITDAGIVLLPSGAGADELGRLAGDALRRILSEPELRGGLVQRSREAHEGFFSWTAIAARFAELLGK